MELKEETFTAASFIEPHYLRGTKIAWSTHIDGILCTSEVVDGNLTFKATDKELTPDAALRLSRAIQQAINHGGN